MNYLLLFAAFTLPLISDDGKSQARIAADNV